MRGSSEQPQLFARLVNVRSLPVDIRYLTLSHACGIEPKFLTLARENLDQFQQSIPLSAADFNQSFRDAMRLTVGLGSKYIWIDSLCIIQEKPAIDWAAECLRMGFIYSNSDLNLSASGFADARSGMLGPPRRPIITPTFSCLEGDVLVIYTDEYSPRNLSLDTRKWVIQENMLVI